MRLPFSYLPEPTILQRLCQEPLGAEQLDRQVEAYTEQVLRELAQVYPLVADTEDEVRRAIESLAAKVAELSVVAEMQEGMLEELHKAKKWQ